ncbi:MAG: hypothetical protein GQ574_09160 [Crocinitomix sp.]|nr:hypothetical protein [Crocinitomix sp.]
MKFYGVGTYKSQEKKLIFTFDSTLFKPSNYTCTHEKEDSIQLKVISTFSQTDISNYYFYINGDKNMNGWNGSEAITMSLDSVLIDHRQHNPVTIYPKKDSCTCYWITLGFKEYHLGNEHLILDGEIAFKRKTLSRKNLYKHLYNSDRDIVYKKIAEQSFKGFIGNYDEPFILKKP